MVLANKPSSNRDVAFTLARDKHGIIAVLAEAEAVTVKLSEVAVLPCRPHDESLRGVRDLIALKYEHLKLSKLILIDSSHLNLINGVVVRNREFKDPLLILLEKDIVHFAWRQKDLSLNGSFDLVLALLPAIDSNSDLSDVNELLSTNDADILTVERAPQVILINVWR